MSPLTDSAMGSPSRLSSLACGMADMTRTVLGDTGLNWTWWTGCVSELAEVFEAVGSTDLNALKVVGVMEAKSWNLTVQSVEPVISRDPEASRVIEVMDRSWVLRTSS